MASQGGQRSGDAPRVRRRLRLVRALGWAVALTAGSGPVAAQVRVERPAPEVETLRHPDLFIPNVYRSVESLEPSLAEPERRRLAALGVSSDRALLDVRGGRWGTLILARPLVPGSGVGNDLTWAALGAEEPTDSGELRSRVWTALVGYLEQGAEALGIDVAELPRRARIAIDDGGDRIRIHASRSVRGIPVRDSYLTAVVSHGNLVLLGFRNWGTVAVPTVPRLSATAAASAIEAHLAPVSVVAYRRPPTVALVPMAAGADLDRMVPGGGYRYRLVWVLEPDLTDRPESWEALVDADSGELLSFLDRNAYASTRKVVGGVYPRTNDGTSPGGTEEPGFPMPAADVLSGGEGHFTDAGGNLLVCSGGSIHTMLDGSYVGIVELCGQLHEIAGGDLDLGTSGGTDCTVPSGASPGNTHSARTAFYHLNRIREIGEGQLPGSGWLDSQLTTITNFPAALLGCNAFWDGSTVTLFSSDPAHPPDGCSNTGELAGVIVHEWAHGLDDNDLDGELSNPAEGMADVFAALYLDDSCIARGFNRGTNCDTGDGDPCLSCDGVRDIDWAMRASGLPHDIEFINTRCPVGLGEPGPCGGAVHCEGAVVSEAAWDLLTRDLPAGPGAPDFNTALEIVTRLFYLGSGVVGQWFQCSPPSGTGDGCNADGGYLNLLAIDDDNGDLGDGTPHMVAIHDAFDRHGIACATPPVQNGGCDGAPTDAPQVGATLLDRGVELSWDPVSGASGYGVFRTEGPFGCSAGKAKVGETTATSFVDEGLLNGFDYSYVVLPIGNDAACIGPASSCVSATPVAGANLSVDPASAELVTSGGDMDSVLDNCETAELRFDLHNIGSGTLSNVRIEDVEVLSHPGTVTITSPLPIEVAPSLDPCRIGRGSFDFVAGGLDFNDIVEFRVQVTADELGGTTRSGTFQLVAAETDLVSEASRTFTFDSDLEGWEVVQGTFERVAGGVSGSDVHVASSADLPEQCDQIRSPLMRLSETSTVSLWNLFDIEGPFDILDLRFWFDRANLGIHNVRTGLRTPVSPDGGRLYNAAGTDGSCVTVNQEGWADSMPTWAESTWSAGTLDAADLVGEVVQLDVGYGTDAAVQGFGFWFDEVTVTDLELLVPDQQPDACGIPCTDTEQLRARCVERQGDNQIQFRLLLSDASHDGEEVTFELDAAPLSLTIQGDRVQQTQGGAATGPHTLELTDPGGCFPPRIFSCP